MKKSYYVSFGAVMSAAAVGILFLTGVFPYATYGLPALAGAAFLPLVIEFGPRKALLPYFAASLLGLFIAPDKEAAVLFVFFFGFYPIIKSAIEKSNSSFYRILLKFLCFNLFVTLAYLVIVFLLGIREVLSEFAFLGQFVIVGVLLFANLAFFLYDMALTNLARLYLFILRPKFKK